MPLSLPSDGWVNVDEAMLMLCRLELVSTCTGINAVDSSEV
jgi:hypothetical protein